MILTNYIIRRYNILRYSSKWSLSSKPFNSEEKSYFAQYSLLVVVYRGAETVISDNLPNRAMNAVGRFPVATHCFHSFRGLSRSLPTPNLFLPLSENDLNREGKGKRISTTQGSRFGFGGFGNGRTTMANDNGNGKWPWDNGNADQQLLPG